MSYIIEIMESELHNPVSGLYAKITERIVSTLTQKYIDDHAQEILAKIDPNVVMNAMAIKIAAEVVGRTLNLKEEKPNG